MAVDVLMPQMGESIAEATLVRWLKKAGDQVERDEPLFEISTDKVDAEVPSPVAGRMIEIRVQQGDTVAVHSLVARIAVAGEDDNVEPVVAVPSSDVLPSVPTPDLRPQEDRTFRTSPVVRRIAREHDVDVRQIVGSGPRGRVTKADILAYLEQPRSIKASAEEAAISPIEPVASLVETPPGAEKLSPMRKAIAEHMVLSRRTSAHVHSVFEVDLTQVAKVRASRKGEYERLGTKLTFLPFIIKASVEALLHFPMLNASLNGDSVIRHQSINVGIAVALDWGLIVPTIKDADGMSLLGLSRAVVDLAARARSKQLKPHEVQGGTFTITNQGVFGALLGTPIINQPQVAILSVGSIEKRPVVVDDALAIRMTTYLTLGFDHRLIDGAMADQFMSRVKKSLQAWDPGWS
jgi:pyruvate dehydrogenase E2 component (dihydrolipoamide acetyltransferase)